jgi:hypothetical protein
MRLHGVDNYLALDHTTIDPTEWKVDEHAWYQWSLLIALYALYEEVLDPTGRCREEHGYAPGRLTFHEVGADGGYVVEGCHRCVPRNEAPPLNTVAMAAVASIVPWRRLELRGTVAWLGDLESRRGAPYGYGSMFDAQLENLSGRVASIRARLFPENVPTGPSTTGDVSTSHGAEGEDTEPA